MSTKNSKASEPHKFVLALPQRLNLKISDKYVAFQNLSLHYSISSLQHESMKN